MDTGRHSFGSREMSELWLPRWHCPFLFWPRGGRKRRVGFWTWDCGWLMAINSISHLSSLPHYWVVAGLSWWVLPCCCEAGLLEEGAYIWLPASASWLLEKGYLSKNPPQRRSGPPGSLGHPPLALGIKLIRIQRPRAMISWHEPCLDPPWALLPLEPRVRSLVGHFGLASIGTERTPHRPAYIIG